VSDDPRSLSFRFAFDSDAVIEQTFARLIHEPWGRTTTEWAPAIDVFETDDAYLVAIEIPGVPPDAVEINVDGPCLTISGERRSVRVTQSGRVVRLERTQGRFSRTVRLEHQVDSKRMELRSEHGVLYARLPKTAPRVMTTESLATPRSAQSEA
jgi:HSP20 family protein